jgi:hypothetical protein
MPSMNAVIGVAAHRGSSARVAALVPGVARRLHDRCQKSLLDGKLDLFKLRRA